MDQLIYSLYSKRLKIDRMNYKQNSNKLRKTKKIQNIRNSI